MIYLLAMLALVAAASGLFGAWEHKGKAEAEAKVQACEAKIEAQNAAIEATKAEGDRRVAAASKGVKAATQATKAARSEAERLRVASRTTEAPSACPAADAVSLIRKGLK